MSETLRPEGTNGYAPPSGGGWPAVVQDIARRALEGSE